MFKVYDKESARDAYKAIKMFSEMTIKDSVKGFTDEVKREVRKWQSEGSRIDSDGIPRRVVKDNGIDGFVELVALPEDIDNEERANDYFYEYIYIEPVNSPFDCTGRAFTGWYKLFNRNGRFCAYHGVSMDV